MIEFIRMGAESSAAIEVDRAKIVYRRLGNGRPLLVLNGFAATSGDWDPLFIHGLASCNELILLDNRGIGSSTDDGKPFDIIRLASDAARVIETLGFERISVLGWSMGGFIAQTLALQHPNRVNKLILLSTDPGRVGSRSRLGCCLVTTRRYFRDAARPGQAVTVIAFSKRCR